MDNFGQPVRYLTFEDILIVAQRHVDNYHLLREIQLRYLVQMVGEKLDDKELFPTLPLKLRFMPITSLRDIYSWTATSVLA